MQRKNYTEPPSNKAEEHKRIQYFVSTEPRNQNKVHFFIHATLHMITEKRPQKSKWKG